MSRVFVGAAAQVREGKGGGEGAGHVVTTLVVFESGYFLSDTNRA